MLKLNVILFFEPKKRDPDLEHYKGILGYDGYTIYPHGMIQLVILWLLLINMMHILKNNKAEIHLKKIFRLYL